MDKLLQINFVISFDREHSHTHSIMIVAVKKDADFQKVYEELIKIEYESYIFQTKNFNYKEYYSCLSSSSYHILGNVDLQERNENDEYKCILRAYYD